jgi:YHS domain-containing protein
VNRTKTEARKDKADLPVLTHEAKDPIWGMIVEVSAAKYKSEFRGNSFYFCCAGCKQSFDKQPDKYALAAAQ